jgi:hypothetical protein
MYAALVILTLGQPAHPFRVERHHAPGANLFDIHRRAPRAQHQRVIHPPVYGIGGRMSWN